MQVIQKPLGSQDIKQLALNIFGDMVKGVVDVEKQILALDAELHSDLEALLLKNGSQQKNLWGINLYPDSTGEEFVEFDSMINMRPSQGNRSRRVEDASVRQKIMNVVKKWVLL
jgi:hypothetical protein